MALKRGALITGLVAAAVTSTAIALTQLSVEEPIVLSVEDTAASGAAGTGAGKGKLLRHRDGTLVAVYDDHVAPPGSISADNFLVYDLKTQAERPPRDVFTRYCKPGEARGDGSTKSCMVESDWSAPVNLSRSATLSSINSDWRGDLDADSTRTVWGDAEKPNGFVNPGGVTVVTWVSHYCPDGDPATTDVIEDPVQRARLYPERDNRIIPFTCTWVNYSTDLGQTWLPQPIQLSSGIRAAKQDVNRGSNSFWMITWQEDPTGLELGEAEGPGDGASGAKVSGGTDIWYAWAPVSNAGTTLGAWNPPVRLTDNMDPVGDPKVTDPTVPSPIVYGMGTTAGVAETPVAAGDIEWGQTGASRANLGSSMSTALVAWEETKNAGIPHSGKYIRYLDFPAKTPPTGEAGCILSNPAKIARRARFVTQNPADAGTAGIHIALFWREGEISQGGPADIMLRRGIGGVTPEHLQPAVDFGSNNTDTIDCTASLYSEAVQLESASAENISSRTKQVAATGIDNLNDDTELQATETGLAHRALLRGDTLWLGYLYTKNLQLLLEQNHDNYNFWIRQFNWDSVAQTGTWGRPKQISNVADTDIIAREPRLVGTPPSGPACDAINAPTGPDCRNTDIFYVAWGTQTNTLPSATEPPKDLGLWITRTTDGGATFEPIVPLSTAQGVFSGSLPDDEEAESAFESQIRLPPDGSMFYAVWNQKVSDTATHTKFTRGFPEEVSPADESDTATDEDITSTQFSLFQGEGDGGGCTLATGTRGIDPLLPAVVLLALAYLGLRRRSGKLRK
ncbi:MAG: choice-of-anchor O protein [Pseudomonadota bacterium]